MPSASRAAGGVGPDLGVLAQKRAGTAVLPCEIRKEPKTRGGKRAPVTGCDPGIPSLWGALSIHARRIASAGRPWRGPNRSPERQPCRNHRSVGQRPGERRPVRSALRGRWPGCGRLGRVVGCGCGGGPGTAHRSWLRDRVEPRQARRRRSRQAACRTSPQARRLPFLHRRQRLDGHGFDARPARRARASRATRHRRAQDRRQRLDGHRPLTWVRVGSAVLRAGHARHRGGQPSLALPGYGRRGDRT